MSKSYIPNGTKEDISLGILHSTSKGFYVTNEGSQKSPQYYVWIPCITHAKADSAYSDISLAVARCDYLSEQSSNNVL